MEADPSQFPDTPEITEEQRLAFVVENNLGLCYAGIPALYKFAFSHFNKLKLAYRHKKEEEDNHQIAHQLFDFSRILLIVNADNYTAWNARLVQLALDETRELTCTSGKSY